MDKSCWIAPSVLAMASLWSGSSASRARALATSGCWQLLCLNRSAKSPVQLGFPLPRPIDRYPAAPAPSRDAEGSVTSTVSYPSSAATRKLERERQRRARQRVISGMNSRGLPEEIRVGDRGEGFAEPAWGKRRASVVVIAARTL